VPNRHGLVIHVRAPWAWECSAAMASDAARRLGPAGPASSLTCRKDAIDTQVPDALGFVW